MQSKLLSSRNQKNIIHLLFCSTTFFHLENLNLPVPNNCTLFYHCQIKTYDTKIVPEARILAVLIRIPLRFILMFGCRRINRKRKIPSCKQACIGYLSFSIYTARSLFKLDSREINYNDFNSVFATFHRFIRHIFCPDFDWYKNCTQILLTPTQQNLFFDQRHIDQFLQFFLQHRFIRQL